MTSLRRALFFLRLRVRHLGRRIDSRLLISVFAVLLLIWLFAELAEWVEAGASERFDVQVMLAFRDGPPDFRPMGPPWLPGAVRDLTALGSAVVLSLIVIAVVIFQALRGRWHTAIFLLVTVLLGWLLMDLLKEHFGRVRPVVVPHLIEVTTLSFPSGHAKMSAVVYLTLGAVLAQRTRKRRLKLFWIALAVFLTLLIGFSRVYLGVHTPSDVLAGWLAGAAWALLAFLLARAWRYRLLLRNRRVRS